jgi:hypothetical protein
MEQSPSWESNSHSDSQKIPCLLRNPKVHYRVCKGLALVPNLNQMHPAHNFPHYFPNNITQLAHDYSVYTRISQKVKGLLKKAHLLQMYLNETNITFQRNPPRLQRTGSITTQGF